MTLHQLLLCGGRCPDPPDNIAKPFRLLDLPKELRLMVYEQLTVVWNHRSVPLDNYGLKFITVVNPSLLGIRLLATSRFVNEEAGSILNPNWHGCCNLRQRC